MSMNLSKENESVSKPSPKAVVLPDGRISEPPDDALVLEVPGAGWIAFGPSASWRCGDAVGCTVDASWSRHGYSGGVMDRAEMRKLRDHLNALLENSAPNA